MQNKEVLKRWQIGAIIFSIVLGTLMHFVFEWTGENKMIAAFVPVNESTWEHLKLSFFPMVIFGILQYFFVKNISNNYIESKTVGIVTTMLTIITLFYTYTGVIGNNYGIINILIFIVGIILGEYVSYKIMNEEEESDTTSKVLSIIIIIILNIYFVLFTYVTPRINIFREPLNRRVWNNKFFGGYNSQII